MIVVVDVRIRGERLLDLSGKHVASYLAAMVESAALWGLLLFAASSRRGPFRWIASLLFVLLAALAVGGQLYFHRQYSTYLNLDATLFGTSFSESLFSQLRADGKNFLTSVVPPILLATALVWVGRSIIRPRGSRVSRFARYAAPIAVCAALVIPCSYRTVQASTPDVIYLHAVGGLLKELVGVKTTAQIRPGLRTPPAMPELHPAPRATVPGVPHRNILFILTESVRSDVHCSEHRESCPNAPGVNAAVPGRIPLLQMRSTSSTTAIQLAVLWSGLPPIATREELHTAPLLFDYAHAAGFDNAYWTSHHMMFANSRLYVQDLPTSHQCGATDLDPLADIDLGGPDELLTLRVKRDLGQMREPFFAVAHFGNTHVPYRIDPTDAPFQPSLESKAPDDNEAYRNFYKNAVYLQDRTIADLIRFVRSSPFGERTVIVFTSDHGEAFREHGQLGHTGAMLDEEIHVPAWIDAPPGMLGEAEEAALRELRERPVFHTDVTPTILDLMGLWDEPQIAPFRTKMIGQSLLRDGYEDKPIPLSNCTGIWGCAFKNWGMMQGSLKLEAREWDRAWHCYDVLADPMEQRDLGAAACGGLAPMADALFGGVPGAH
ncbi:MAG: sulfatase-like hydrolase/transferase [Polyangiaceae bacterium]|nr:sulfatase-like hydrolase/transferase [Polyangiaceae bacterium]